MDNNGRLPGGNDSDKRFTIGRFSVTHPVLVNILMVAFIILGLFSVARLPQEQFAEVPFFWVNVIVPYPGVSAEDLETTVTIPIENEFQGIGRLKQISSTTSEGLSVVRVEFDEGISNDEFRSLYQEAQTRFSRVELPDGVLPPVIDDFSSADFLPVIEVVLSGDAPYQDLRSQSRLLRDRLLQVRDVSDVDIAGAPERQIVVETDHNRASAVGLTPVEILRAVQDQNTAIPGGVLATETREYLLRTLGSINEIDDIEDVIIRRSNDAGGIIRVGDVARVVEGFDPNSPISRYNGERAISLRVAKVPRGSSVDVVSGTREIVEELERELPAGMSVSLFNDSTVQINSSLSVLTTNAALGLFLLVLILWLFIGLRNAMITALGIPITFALTFLALDLIGETINTNTLFALVLVLGLIVDHAIVIIENSYRMRQLGLDRREAAINGTNQVMLPIIAATATTIAAFLPLMLIPGTIGRFLRVIPLTAAVALAASTGEALFFLPSHFADWGREKEGKKKRPPGWWFAIFRKRYERLLSRMYTHKKKVLLILLAVAAGSFSLAGTLQQDLFSAEDFSYFTIDITMPTGTPFARTDRIVSEFEEIIMEKMSDGDIIAIRSNIGSAAGGSGSTTNSNIAQIIVDLKEQDEGRSRTIEEIMLDIQWAVYYIAGPEQVLFRKAQTGPPTSPPISYRITGDTYSELVAVSQEIQQLLESFPGVINIEDDFTAGSPELQIRVNQERASDLGIDTDLIGRYIRAKFDGLPVGTFFLDNEELDIVLRFDQEQLRGYEQLEESMIPAPDGRVIPLSSVADIVEGSSLGNIRRVDGKREITVTADASSAIDLSEIDASVLDAWEGGISREHPGTELLVGGEFSEFQDLLIDIFRIFSIGIFLIYLILGAQFNSYSQPFLILLAVPFAFVGVVLYLFLSGTPLSTTVIYAGVALAGIAVNDAIVLISFINSQRKEGMAVRKAVIRGAATRLRPIMLTSLTTIMGLLPTAIGIGGESVVWGPMASTIIFGLVFSTITTLVLIPMLYALAYDRILPGKSRVASKGPATAGILLAAVLLSSAPAEVSADQGSFSPGYPDLACCEISQSIVEKQPDAREVKEFLAQWAVPPQGAEAASIAGLASRLAEILKEGNPALGQLESVYSMQNIQLQGSRDERKPVITLMTDPQQNPLYAYRMNSAQGQAPVIEESHIFGLGAEIRQPLPTAGSISLGAAHQAAYETVGNDWAWRHNPQVSLAFEQPLFVSDRILQTDAWSSTRRQEELARDAAYDTLIHARDGMVLQSLNLLHARQSLLEVRWALDQQADLLRDDIAQAEKDLNRGLISRSDYRKLVLQLDQLLLDIAGIHKELNSLEGSLEEMYGYPVYAQMLLLPRADTIEKALRLYNNPIAEDSDMMDRMLAADPDYQEASRNIALAQLEKDAGSPADAPRLGVSLQSSLVPGDVQNTFTDSVKQLASSDASFSVSVSLQVPDLMRRTANMTASLSEERRKQAELKQLEALQAVEAKAEHMDSRIGNQLAVIAILLEEYLLEKEARQEEELLVSSRISDKTQLRRRETAETSAAFQVLEGIRELEVILLELEIMTRE